MVGGYFNFKNGVKPMYLGDGRFLTKDESIRLTTVSSEEAARLLQEIAKKLQRAGKPHSKRNAPAAWYKKIAETK